MKSARVFLTPHELGRAIIHLMSICRRGCSGFHFSGVLRQWRFAFVALVVAVSGCDNKPAPAKTSGTMLTQGGTSEAATTYADENLANLTRELRRWIVKTKQRPASFEEFASAAKLTVTPAPAGKKYAISGEMRVILVNK